jgi:hypothetical protein
MLKIILVALLFSLTLQSCSNAQNTVPQSNEDEKNAVEHAMRFFGGKAIHMPFISKVNGNNTLNFEIQIVNNSQNINDFNEMLALPASGIAYMFYDKLIEKDKFQNVRVVINSNQKKHEYTIPVKDLKTAHSKMTAANLITDYIKQRDYNKLASQIDTSLVGNQKEMLLGVIKEKIEKVGDVQKFVFLGFRLDKLNEIDVVHLSGILQGIKDNTPYSIDFPIKEDASKPVFIVFEF